MLSNEVNTMIDPNTELALRERCPHCGEPLTTGDGYSTMFQCGTMRNDHENRTDDCHMNEFALDVQREQMEDYDRIVREGIAAGNVMEPYDDE